ncbi:MAG: hypothetical protein AVDCRST_MAG79-1609, partial [uncultured Thermoleophilia bacterium]
VPEAARRNRSRGARPPVDSGGGRHAAPDL